MGAPKSQLLQKIIMSLVVFGYNKYMKSVGILFSIVVVLFGLFVFFMGVSRNIIWERSVLSPDRNGYLEYDPNILYTSCKYEPAFRQKFDEAVRLIGDDVALSEYVIVVDYSEQYEYIFSKFGDLVERYRISTAKDSEYFTLPQERVSGSVWRVSFALEKNVPAGYGPAIFMLDKRVGGIWYKTTIALHGGNKEELIGIPWTPGCVYHMDADIIEVANYVELGTFVVIVP